MYLIRKAVMVLECIEAFLHKVTKSQSVQVIRVGKSPAQILAPLYSVY